MIRDPSDGSVKPVAGITTAEITEESRSKIYSGLPLTSSKAEYLARLEESRKWLKNYVRPTII